MVEEKLARCSLQNANISDTSMSEYSAEPSTTGENSARTLTPPTEEEDDDSSVVSTSSEEPSSDSDEESEGEDAGSGGRIPVRGMPKPVMRLQKDDKERSQSLRDRLKEFLPQIAAANEELEKEQAAGTLKDRDIEIVDEESGQYIEMNLGLGVLEEKRPGSTDSDTESESAEPGHEMSPGKERDILGKLMGQKRGGGGGGGSGIQEVNEDR